MLNNSANLPQEIQAKATTNSLGCRNMTADGNKMNFTLFHTSHSISVP